MDLQSTLAEHATQINEAVSAMIEMEGMKALNKERELAGASLGYTQADFDQLLANYGLGHNSTKPRNFHL